MSEFCSQCYKKYGFRGYDYDHFEIALKLKKGRSINLLCEGWGIRTIYKDDAGLIHLGRIFEDEIVLTLNAIEELLPSK